MTAAGSAAGLGNAPSMRVGPLPASDPSSGSPSAFAIASVPGVRPVGAASPGEDSRGDDGRPRGAGAGAGIDLLVRPRARVVRNSQSTYTYGSTGQYPFLRNFQVARPLPEVRPFGMLPVDPGPGGSRRLIAGSYGRVPSASSSRFLDDVR